MRRLLVTCALVSLTLAGCGKDKDNDVATDATTTTTEGVASATAPPSTAKTTTTVAVKATTTTQSDGRAAADAQSPAAGACADAVNGVGLVAIKGDVPQPRCIIVHDDDHVQVRNDLAFEIRVEDGVGGFTVKPGKTEGSMKAIGALWQPGVHVLHIFNAATNAPVYGGSGPEIWLK